MKKVIYTLVLLLVACATEAQLLYRISGNGLEKPSYIVGTYHMEDSRYVLKIDGAKEALAEVEQVCGEVPFDDMLNPDSLALLNAAMRLPEGQTLKDVLTKKQLQRVDDAMKKVMGYGLTNKLVFEGLGLGTMSPESMMNILSLYMFAKTKQEGFDPTNGLDNYFQKEAMRAGKPVIGLETMSFQTQVLFGGTPMKKQVKNLMAFVKDMDAQQASVKAVVDAYHSQDLEQIDRLMVGEKSDDVDRLIYDRNAQWVKQMPSIMENHSTLFAVGAGHLPGEKGVLELLRRAGYEVEGVVE